jgi:D-alanine-D-alanine ligase
MTADLGVLVLAGGLSYERDVSLRSGRRVLDALRGAGIDATLRDADATLLPYLQADPPSAVVIALHGATGEDGSLRGVLDLCGVAYVGCDARASRLAWDKPSAKAMLRERGIHTPDWVALPHDRFSELGAVAVLDRIVDRLGLPLMVKPAQGGSGLGAAVVRDATALPAAMVGCFAYDSTALVERYVSGIDVAVSVVDLGDGPQALPAVEIVPRDGVYDYAARYTAGLTTWHAPARLPSATAAKVASAALASHAALGLRDLSRVDLIVDESGEPWVLGCQRLAGDDGDVAIAAGGPGGRLGLRQDAGHLVGRAASRVTG